MAKLLRRRAQRGAFLVHVDEDLAEPAVIIFAGAQEDRVAADLGLLRIALAAAGQLLLLAVDPLDHALDDPLGDLRGTRRGRRGDQRLDHLVLVLLLVGDQRGVERLRQLGAVAVERVGLQRQLPRQHVGALAVLDGRVVRHVDGLGDGARDEGLRRRHHADVAFHREIALADLAARIGAVEHRQVLGLEERRAFQRHGAADMDVGGLDVLPGEAELRPACRTTCRRAARR